MKKKTVPVTDHTKAILVGLAYVIGFTTAYIAFELNDYSSSYVVKENYQTESRVVQQASAYGAVRTITNSEGLFVASDEGERIISAATNEDDLEFGFHKEIVSTSVSQDGTMVHYCATMDDTDSCYHFVYVISEDVVHPVRDKDRLLVTSSMVAKESNWLTDNRLSIGGTLSQDSTTPWLMP